MRVCVWGMCISVVVTLWKGKEGKGEGIDVHCEGPSNLALQGVRRQSVSRCCVGVREQRPGLWIVIIIIITIILPATSATTTVTQLYHRPDDTGARQINKGGGGRNI